MFWMAFFVSLAISVVGELLRPKQKPTDAKPAAIDDFNLPTISETRNWPWMAGTCLIEGGNVTWYGDLRTEEIKKKVKTGWFSSTRVTVNHKYILGIEMMLTIGAIDDVSQVRFNGDAVPSNLVSKSVTDDEIVFNFNAPEFMGGNEEGGGIVGTLRIARGTGTQNANSYVQTVLGRLRSAYRGLCFAVFESFYLGTRENIPAISFVVHRYPNTLGLSDGRHIIEGDANPACMIYELLTDMRWGGQFPSSRVNIAKFIAIGNQLYDEGYGLSMLVNSARSLQDQIAEILRHIDGVLYTDPDTGLIDISLARDDYNVDELPRFDESSISSFQWSRGSWSETKNTLILQYVDREDDFTVRPVPLRDTANVFGRGGVVEAETLDLLGFSRADPAIRRGHVALKTFSYPLLTGKVQVNSRRARKLRPGSVIVVDWSPDGLAGIVLRVSRIGYGDPMGNQVELDCIEDIFSLTNASYSLPPPSNWQNPVGPPQPLAAQYAFEAPYHLVGEAARYIITVGARAGGIDSAYETWHDPAGGSSYRLTGNVADFTPTGVLFSEYPSTTPAIDPIGFVVTSARDFGSLENPTQGGFEAGDALALIRSTAGEEIIAWKTVANNGNGSYTVRDVMRGVLDTLPLDHPAGARIWMITEGMGLLSEEPYAADGTVTAKLLPRNVRGVLPIADAPQLSVAVSSRARKPYPAANPKVNGVSDDHVIHGDAEITWSIRHRVEQTEAGVVVPQDAPSFTDQPEGGYEVRVYIDGTARRTVQITEPPFDRFTYTVADRIADDADVSKNVCFGLTAVNGSLRSAERKSQEFFMVDALDPLTIETIELPSGREAESYSFTLVASGGAQPYAWSIASGTLPDGLTLSEQGVLSGVPTGPVDATFTVRVEDAVGATASRQYDLSISGGECEDYTIPAAVGTIYDILDTEEPLPPEGNELHICNTITNPPEPSEDSDPHWANVVSLLHFEGVHGGTSFADEKGNEWGVAGGASISTAQKMFGASSGAFLSTLGDRIYADGGATLDSESPLYIPADADFTIECFAQKTGGSWGAIACIAGVDTGLYFDNQYRLTWYDGGTKVLSGEVALSVFHHVAATRKDGLIRVFLDGILVGVPFASDIVGNRLFLGGNTNGSEPLSGYIDEFRFTKGVARYTDNFAPPTKPFPNK